MLWVGVDIGGTFTDVIVYDVEARLLRAAKSLSTPAEPVPPAVMPVSTDCGHRHDTRRPLRP